jgi:carbonic anhydrase
MRRIIVTWLLILVVLVCGSSLVVANTPGTMLEKMTPDGALRGLLEGNARFVKQQMTSLSSWGAAEGVAKSNRPCAIVLTCSDMRIPPEILFDKASGCLYVLRVAGNVINPAMLGSIEYGVEQLGIPLVMVLGHERCGVVSSVVAAKGSYQGNLGSLLKTIEPAVRKASTRAAGASSAEELLELAIDMNARMVAGSLAERSSVVKRLMEEKQVRIVAARVAGNRGNVTLLD